MDRYNLFSDDPQIINVITFAIVLLCVGALIALSGGVLALVSSRFIYLPLEGFGVAAAGAALWTGALLYERKLRKRDA